MTLETPEQIAAESVPDLSPGNIMHATTVREVVAAAIEADRAQRADEIELPEEWDTTLRIIDGDGEEHTDTVRLTFTRDWDETLTRTHHVSWETFMKVLAVAAREEEAQSA